MIDVAKNKTLQKIFLLVFVFIAGLTLGYFIFPQKIYQIQQSPSHNKQQGLSFSFNTPAGWHVLNRAENTNNIGLENNKYDQTFILNSEPITFFPHHYQTLTAKGYPSLGNENDFNRLIKKFDENQDSSILNLKKLNWQTGKFPGQCFVYDYDQHAGPVLASAKENITCFVLIKSNKLSENNPEFFSTSRLFVFEYHGYYPDTDISAKNKKTHEKNLSTLQQFFASLGELE
ncbi:MAG: hypothetical protein GF390_02155 [Candidatus Pacebacteria bacterium]|nr:hypothetical protein [Candidatus Paceibacterota bacterium]